MQMPKDMTEYMMPLEDVLTACAKLAQMVGRPRMGINWRSPGTMYGVPRGGVPVTYLLWRYMPYVRIVSLASEADIIVDDIIDTGKTREQFPDRLFVAPFIRRGTSIVNGFGAEVIAEKVWIIFPWEDPNEHRVKNPLTRGLINASK